MTGGKIVGAVVLGRVISHLTGRAMAYRVQELHSTKGWRPVYEVPTRRFAWSPVVGAFHWADGCGPRRDPPDEARIIPEKALLRHGWYRRKLRKEAERAA